MQLRTHNRTHLGRTLAMKSSLFLIKKHFPWGCQDTILAQLDIAFPRSSTSIVASISWSLEGKWFGSMATTGAVSSLRTDSSCGIAGDCILWLEGQIPFCIKRQYKWQPMILYSNEPWMLNFLKLWGQTQVSDASDGIMNDIFHDCLPAGKKKVYNEGELL